jgi:hypothetical protein
VEGEIVDGDTEGERESPVEKQERRRQPDWYRQKGASLIGALLCYKRASAIGALLSTGHALGPGGSLGYHRPWCPVAHLGRQDGWRTISGSQYGKHFVGGVFMKIVSKRVKMKKLHLSSQPVWSRPYQ